MSTLARCTRCGESIGPADRFCARCGADLSSIQGAVATEVVPAQPGQPRSQQAGLLDALRQVALGEYEVLAEVGQGGMATVFLAHEIALDRKVAIKVMSPALLAGEGMIERFKREARTAASLSHPNIIPIYAVKESEHLFYFVMKFVEGRPLDSIIKEAGALPIPMIQAILNQVGAALGYAHKRGVVHRDVKPANILVDAEGWAVVTDFGIAKVAQAEGLTMTGVTVGTPSYMSPEQGASKPLTGASDQYSLGVVAYEMLAGRPPFVAESVMAIMYAHFNEPPASIADVRPDTPSGLAAAVMRMLDKEPDRRWPTMEAAVAAVGGMPLAHDDPIRTQLVTLAAAGPSALLLKRVSTPASPMPGGRVGRTTNITALTISPAQVTTAVGGAVQLTATAKRPSGGTQPGRGITWASTNPKVVVVSPAGLATGVGVGTATVTATQENTSATATISVTGAEARRRRMWPVLAALVVVGAAGALWWLRPWAATGGSEAISTPARPAPEAPGPAGPATPAAGTPTAPPPTKPGPRTPAERRPQLEQARGAAPAPSVPPPTQQAPRPPVVQRPDTPAREPLRPLTPPTAAAAAPAPAPAAAAAPVDPRPQIERAIANYAQAIQARDINAVKRAAPGLGSDVLKNLRDFFEAVRDLKVTLQVKQVSMSESTAVADVSGTYDFVQNGKKVSQAVSFRATLERGAEGWHITAVAPLQ